MPRYVILCHHTPAGYERPRHWDFMLEVEDALHTWALDEQPCYERWIQADRLPDHRKAYLDYEGPLSRQRGEVSRWDAGSYQVVRESEDELVVRLQGARLIAVATLAHSPHATQRWRVRFAAP